MNSLLKHQVKKYLSSKNVSNEDLMIFLDAVNRSYDNFDEQQKMQQRAMEISSEELSEANKILKQESKIQSSLIDKLNKVIENLNFGDLSGAKTAAPANMDNLDGLKLAEFIDKQTQEIVEMNKQREKLMGELESQNEELSNYAYLVSHDLKSPLRSIDALTAWMNEDENDKNATDNKSESLKMIRDNVEKMDNLITGILNYSTINKAETQIGKINIHELVSDIIKEIELPEHIYVNLVNKLPEMEGDKHRLKQLFEHLIDNAIKYIDKEKGQVEVGVTEEAMHWKFHIKDNGKGIEKNYFDKIFKPFQKLENNPNSTGIGLSIAKKIVNAYGGKMWLESTLGVGTTFYFTLKK